VSRERSEILGAFTDVASYQGQAGGHGAGGCFGPRAGRCAPGAGNVPEVAPDVLFPALGWPSRLDDPRGPCRSHWAILLSFHRCREHHFPVPGRVAFSGERKGVARKGPAVVVPVVTVVHMLGCQEVRYIAVLPCFFVIRWPVSNAYGKKVGFWTSVLQHAGCSLLIVSASLIGPWRRPSAAMPHQNSAISGRGGCCCPRARRT